MKIEAGSVTFQGSYEEWKVGYTTTKPIKINIYVYLHVYIILYNNKRYGLQINEKKKKFK